MSGVSVIGELLTGDTDLLAVVPVARIKAGAIPQKVDLPAIAVTSISSVDRNILSPGESRRVRELVQVTVLAANYRDKRTVLQLVKRACADRQGSYAGVTEVVVLTNGAGPDFMSTDATIWMGAQDFAVSFNEPTA